MVWIASSYTLTLHGEPDKDPLTNLKCAEFSLLVLELLVLHLGSPDMQSCHLPHH